MTELKDQLKGQFRCLDALLLRYYMWAGARDGVLPPHKEKEMRRYYAHAGMGNSFPMTPHRGQGRVLSLLKLQPEIGQKELGYLLDMSKQALAELLSKLEKNGYITRTESEKDRRSYIIKLTEKGREAFSDIEMEENDDFGALFDCLNEEEQRNLSDYIGRIIAALEERVGSNDRDDYAEFFRERFFAEHGFDQRGAPPFRRGGFTGRPNRRGGGPSGPEDDRKG